MMVPSEASWRAAPAPTPALPRHNGWPMEGLVLAVIALLVALSNLPFWHTALAGRSAGDFSTWRFVFCAALLLVGLHALPVLLLATRWTVRPLLALLIVCSVIAQHMMLHYGIVLDPSMLRNVLRTDVREASELVTAGLLANTAIAVAAVALMWRTPLRSVPWRRALGRRAMVLAGVLLGALAALLFGFQDMSSLMRNQKELRYQIAPGNVLYSTGRVLAADWRDARRVSEPLQPIRKVATQPGQKPRLMVMVVGETARAMNFSLNGYARKTNPELAELPIINFPQTTACGTSTEVSLPCMFSPYGRADYDEQRIRGAESLVQLLARAGTKVVWLDNQSGCKKVCEGVEFRDLSSGTDPRLCPDGHCLDGVLVQGLAQVIDSAAAAPGRDTLVVLHQLGNHGPAYAHRYPAAYARYTPECTKRELRDCSREEIVNAYDNAILYTDHVVASAIQLLRQQQERYDVGLVYVSDHGESLGEKGLYLHGMPYAIAPHEQLAVPMIWWLGGSGVSGWGGVDAACLRQRATKPAQHDLLFHSILGLMGVSTAQYKQDRDIISTCRPPGSPA